MHQAAPQPSIADTKRTLRTLAAEARAAAHAEHGDSAPQRLKAAGLELLRQREPRIASGFMPFRTEIDVRPLLDALAEAGWRTALPVIEGPKLPLTFRAWAPGDPTVAGRWDILHPAPEAPVVEPDVLLVPMLAFDARGFRLGYGGGFYDRSLALLRAKKPVIAIGIAYAGQEVPEVPRGEFDEPLDWILTEKGGRRPCG